MLQTTSFHTGRIVATLLTAGLSTFPTLADSPKSPPAAAKTFEVEQSKPIVYYKGPGAHATRHKLDVFSPKGAKDCPVVVLVPGGAWMVGSKELYWDVGECLARQGVVAVLPNYRLWPGARPQEQIKDVARAFAWTCKNVGEHGGNPKQVFVCGHSAGGHLAALLATDESYLKAEGLNAKAIKGVIPVSGVFKIGGLPLEM